MTPEERIAKRRAELLAKGGRSLGAPQSEAPAQEEGEAEELTAEGRIARRRAELLAKGGRSIMESTPLEVGAGETFVNQAVNTLPLGRTLVNLLQAGVVQGAKAFGAGQPNVRFTPEAREELEAQGTPVNEENVIPGALETFRQMRDIRDARVDAGNEQNPWAKWAGTGTGILLSALAPMPKALGGRGVTAASREAGKAAAAKAAAERAAREAVGLPGETLRQLLGRAAVSAGQGALAGGIQAAGESRADLTRGEFGEQLADTGVGAAIGGAFGGALPLAGAALRGAGRRIMEGLVRPTEEALLLRSRGVPLTTGQMQPKSPIGQVEQAATSVMPIGSQIAEQRDTALQAWRQAVANEVRAPGSAPLDTSKPLSAQLDDIKEGFRELYDIPKGFEVRPETASGMSIAEGFARAAEDPSSRALEDTQKAARRFLDNELSLLPQVRQAEAGGKLPVDALMSMRHNIRKAIADATKEGAKPEASLYRNAERVVTDVLESQLPDYARDALRLADARYGAFKTVEAAIERTGLGPGEFSPKQLEQEVLKSMKGGMRGGELERLAAAAKSNLDTKVPLTGVRTLIMGTPWMQNVGAYGAYLANRPGIQPWLLGEAPGQQALREALSSARAEALRRAASTGGELLPGTATRALLPADTTPPPRAQEAAQSARTSALRRRASRGN